MTAREFYVTSRIYKVSYFCYYYFLMADSVTNLGSIFLQTSRHAYFSTVTIKDNGFLWQSNVNRILRLGSRGHDFNKILFGVSITETYTFRIRKPQTRSFSIVVLYQLERLTWLMSVSLRAKKSSVSLRLGMNLRPTSDRYCLRRGRKKWRRKSRSLRQVHWMKTLVGARPNEVMGMSW